MKKPDSPQSFSQFGEDVIIWKYFNNRSDGCFVDIGANEPEDLSQSALLERNGWNGILVEPLPDCCERLRQHRPKSRVFQVACGAPGQRGRAFFESNTTGSKLAAKNSASPPENRLVEVEVKTLDEILEESRISKIDFLSIDTEGNELNVLHGFNLEKYQPGLLIVEDNFPIRLQVHFYLKRHNYRLVKRTGCNNWYVPRNIRFTLSTPWEKVKLFRKMYIGTAFRKLKNIFRKTDNE